MEKYKQLHFSILQVLLKNIIWFDFLSKVFQFIAGFNGNRNK